MIDFLLAHWRTILSVVLLLVSFLLLLIRKRPKTFIDTFGCVKEAILERLPLLISLCERPGNGSDKLDEVIIYCLQYIEEDVIGRQLSDVERSYFTDFISKHVEAILMTPQKKGVK